MNPQRLILCLVLLLLTASTRADIYRWDTGEVIPGTEGIEPGPGVQLDHRELEFARLQSINLTNANFESTNLTGAMLNDSTLTNANLSGAVVTGARFWETTSRGFTKEQLYSTASYQAKELSGIWLVLNDLSGWDFSGQDLANALLNGSSLTNTSLDGAMVTGARFEFTTGFAEDQLYSTASYQAKNLSGIGLGSNDLSGWDFSGQNLSNADLYSSMLTNANLIGANLTDARLARSALAGANLAGAEIKGADLSETTSHGFTASQLLATASYQTRNLKGIQLSFNDLSGWDFSHQNLEFAGFGRANLSGADLTGAVVTGASFFYTVDFTRDQLYSTWSYGRKDLRGIELVGDFSGWNFRGQNLAHANPLPNLGFSADMTGADFTAADLRGILDSYVFLTGTILTNTIRPDGSIIVLDLTNNGELAIRDDDPWPGWRGVIHEPVAVRILQSMAMDDTSLLQIHFDTDPWDSMVSFEPDIPVQLGGTLELTFADDVDVFTQIGRTIRLFDWTGVEPTGAFTVSSLYPWDVSELYTTGEVTLLLPGDTNGDQVVNLEDLNNVRNNFGLSGEGIAGDTNNDQAVDLTDLNNVRNFFGVTAPQPVPEPSTGFILLFSLVVLATVSGRRRRIGRSGIAILVCLLLSLGGERARAGRIDEMFVFGDSHSDVGNWGPLTGEGRFSNGPVWVDRLAETFGLPPLAPGFVSTRTNPEGGNDYAFGAARTGNGHDPFDGFQVPRVGAQIDRYLTFHEPTPNTLLVLLAGHNDFLLGGRDPAVPVANLTAHVRRLVEAGGRRFLVGSRLHSIGHMPLYHGTAEADTFDDLADRFNELLPAELTRLESELDVTVHLFDLAGLEAEVLADPGSFGFTNVTDAAYLTTSANPDEYVYWDEVHFSAAFHRLFGQRAAAAVPEPTSFLLLAAAALGLAVCGNALRMRHNACMRRWRPPASDGP